MCGALAAPPAVTSCLLEIRKPTNNTGIRPIMVEMSHWGATGPACAGMTFGRMCGVLAARRLWVGALQVEYLCKVIGTVATTLQKRTMPIPDYSEPSVFSVV